MELKRSAYSSFAIWPKPQNYYFFKTKTSCPLKHHDSATFSLSGTLFWGVWRFILSRLLSKDTQSTASLLMERISHVWWTVVRYSSYTHFLFSSTFCVSFSTKCKHVQNIADFPCLRSRTPETCHIFGMSWELLMHEEPNLGPESALTQLATRLSVFKLGFNDLTFKTVTLDVHRVPLALSKSNLFF